MQKKFDIIKQNSLWNGIDLNEFEKMFQCMETNTRRYKKGEIILLTGDPINYIGLIISGGVKIIKEDIYGNITIITELSVSEFFGEVLVCAGIKNSPITVESSDETEILFINYRKIITTCASACSFHSKLIENMLGIIANKNLMLNQKIEILSKRTIRDKLLIFFGSKRDKKFTIPYNREELAQYLCVDRSALSNELCKMRDEGLIKFRKNEFEILGEIKDE